MKSQQERSDVYERVTRQIIEVMEKGAGDWRMPWHQLAGSTKPVNVISRKRYRGINVLALWATALEKGFQSGIWATYPQWKELGAQVRKGEQSALVVFWKFDQSKEETQSDNDEESTARRLIVARGYHVFNAEQVSGFSMPAAPELPEAERDDNADRFFSHLGAEIRHGGSRAYYDKNKDLIQLPFFEVFKERAAYYSTLAHETTHWSGSPQRLNRDLSGRFGNEAYAAEELIAELGAAFLCADLEMASVPRLDHAAYVQNWLSVLRHDKKAIFTAASKAQAAVDWMHSRQPSTAPVASESA